MAAELEEGAEVQRTEQRPQDGTETLTETTVDCTPLPSEEAKIETDRLESEEVKEGKDKVCEDENAQVAKADHLTEDKELEKETTHSKETGGPQN